MGSSSTVPAAGRTTRWLCSRPHREGTGSYRLNSSARICIAREGYVRVCQHIVIRWSDIESWAAQYELDSAEEYKLIILSSPICQVRCH